MTVSLSDLKLLLQTVDAADADVQLFATQGQLVVDELLVGSGLSTAMQDQIALLLSAHFGVVSTEYGGLKQSKIGESEDHYRAVAADKVGFLTTRFGQQACALDTTGTLIGASQQWNRQAVIDVVRPACE